MLVKILYYLLCFDFWIFCFALFYVGKNFDAIEKYMLSRAKKRGDGTTKNREKARYFYYRAWHKLSRYVQFPPSKLVNFFFHFN